jgi:hypothetical protein
MRTPTDSKSKNYFFLINKVFSTIVFSNLSLAIKRLVLNEPSPSIKPSSQLGVKILGFAILGFFYCLLMLVDLLAFLT